MNGYQGAYDEPGVVGPQGENGRRSLLGTILLSPVLLPLAIIRRLFSIHTNKGGSYVYKKRKT